MAIALVGHHYKKSCEQRHHIPLKDDDTFQN